jgi:hypothetical protein
LIGFAVAALAVIAAVIAQIVFPGKSIYHTGWYNVALMALTAVALASGRKTLRRARKTRPRLAAASAILGAAIGGFAGVACGLLAPDTQTIVGAPGQRVPVEALGVLAFPIASAGTAAGPVTLERSSSVRMEIGERPHDAGNFVVRELQRDVAYVEARDLRGNRLTVTQPSGSAFLSPVLLMERRQTIAGLDLPYDSFNVPAARRVVKAVLYNGAVLFAVDDANERPLRNAIAMSFGGKAVSVGGVSLRGAVEQYPAVEVVAVPNTVAAGLGSLLLFGGLLALVARPVLLSGDDGPDVSQDDAAPGELDASRG